MVHQSSALSVQHLVAAVAPGSCDAMQHLLEGGHAKTRRRWEVGAAEKRRPIGRQKNRHGPAAATGHGLDRLHIDAGPGRAAPPGQP